MGKRLSVIVPTYNCEAYLGECLESVLSQLPSDCELVVVDDGSQDSTAQKLAALDGTRSNLRIIFREHGGVSAARNAGLDASHGEFFAFLDCDDRMCPDFLARGLPLLDSGADLVIFGIDRILLSGRRETWGLEDAVYPTISDFADEYVRSREMRVYSVCNKFYRRCVAKSLGLRFEEGLSFGEDRLFNFKFLAGASSVVTSRLVMYQYIQRSGRSLSTVDTPNFPDLLMRLAEAKTDCILSLSKGTSDRERHRFALENRNDVLEALRTLSR